MNYKEALLEKLGQLPSFDRDVERVAAAFIEAQVLHHRVYALIGDLRERIANTHSNETLTDLALLFERMSKLAEDMRKECSGAERQCERIACLRWIQAGLNGPAEDLIRGELGTGRPDIKTMAPPPNHNTNPEEYRALMQHLGVRADTAENELVKINWPRFQEHITELTRQGLALPPGIGKTYQDYVLRITPKRDLDSLVSDLTKEDRSSEGDGFTVAKR